MALLDTESIRHPLAKLMSIEFQLLTTEDILRLSVYSRKESISKQSELMDNRLGLPNTTGECPTCGDRDPYKAFNDKGSYKAREEKDFDRCEGHFGHITFPSLIYHPSYVCQIARILNKLCLYCLSLKRKKEKNAANLESGKRKGPNGRNSCKYCKKGLHPKLEVKVERTKLDKKVIEKIYIEAEESDDGLPSDYLKFFGKQFEDFEFGRQCLYPSEAFGVLSMIPDKVLQCLGMGISGNQPGALILRQLLVPPNCNRIPMGPSFLPKGFGLDIATKQLREILKKLSQLKSAATAMEKRIGIDGMQASLADYLRVKGAPKVRGNTEPSIDYGKGSKLSLGKAYSERFKQQCMKYSSFTGRAVVTGDPFLSLDEIGIPYEIAEGMTIRTEITSFNLHQYKSGARPMFVTRGGLKVYMTQNAACDVQIGDVVDRNLQDGDLVFCTRAPAYHKHAFVGLRARLIDARVLAINPVLCSPLGADFDGDCFHVFFPQSLHSRAEVVELLMAQKQMLLSHGGQCTFQLSQDALLAVHLITRSGVFITKETMQQSSMWKDAAIPKPAIVKSSSGPYWTGNQLFELTLPRGLDYDLHGVHIRNGQVLITNGEADWLKSSIDGLLHTIITSFGGEVAMEFLNLSQNISSARLLQRGFSLGLKDVYAVAGQPDSRLRMQGDVRTKLHQIELTIGKRTCSLGSLLRGRIEQKGGGEGSSKREHSSKHSYEASLKQLAIEHMQYLLYDIEHAALKHVHEPNSFLSMMRAGSKGSKKKFVEQFAFVGLQRCSGKETGELVHSSFIEGLSSHEFFVHTLAYRGSMVGQREQVTDAGSLFKKLMLFMRDVYVEYDGTVRSEYGKHIIQFQYSDEIGACCAHEKSPGISRYEMDKGDLAGEPVGMLAATAIAHPVYEMKSDSPVLLKISLKTLEEILYSRKSSNQKVLLFIPNTLPSQRHVKEKIAMRIKQSLHVVTLDMLWSCVSVHYATQNDEADWPELPPTTVPPWIVHISLDKDALNTWKITAKDVVERLMTVTEVHQFGSLSFIWKENCQSGCQRLSDMALDCTCILFRLISQPHLMRDPLLILKNDVLPLVMTASIIGDARIAAVEIIPLEMVNDSWIADMQASSKQSEVVLEIIVKKGLKENANAWHVIMDVCGPFMDLIDWQRSLPCGNLRLQETYGVEAIRHCLFQRLMFIMARLEKPVHPKHMMLLADMMTHTGNVLGFLHGAYGKFCSSLNFSSPMTMALFQKPVEQFQKAAWQGTRDCLSGTLASICWGRAAPLGTGANFDLFWKA